VRGFIAPCPSPPAATGIGSGSDGGEVGGCSGDIGHDIWRDNLAIIVKGTAC
jgi:hypothetical protein